MREARLIETREVPLADIRVSGRLRPASDAAVAALEASIGELGTALTAIALRRSKDRLVLIGGLHRLEAYRRLGRATIRADVWDCTDDWARLAEIDENLAGAELSIVEMARFLAQRKALYEKLHPETVQGPAGALARWDDATETVSFASSISQKRGISERHVRGLARIGHSLDPEAGAILQCHPVPPTYRELKRLVEMPGMAQADAAKRLGDGRARTLKAAIDMVEPLRARREALNPVEAAERDLRTRFRRAPMAAKRRFLRHLAEDYAGLLREEVSLD